MSSEVLEQLEQQQTLIAQLKHLVRENEQELKDKEKQLEDSRSSFKKFKLQSRAKINQLTNQMKDSSKDKDEESEGSSSHSLESSDQGSRAKVILLKKQLEESKHKFEKQEQEMKDQITCLQSTVLKLEDTTKDSLQASPTKVIKQQPNDARGQLEKGSQELYAQIVYKDSKILDLNNQILELEGKIMDLQEHVREKDQVLTTRNKAIQLMTEDQNRRGQSVTDALNETRREMQEMQERFASSEASWQEEKRSFQALLQTVREDEVQQTQQELKKLEGTRFDLATRNAELQEKVVHLQKSLQAAENSRFETIQDADRLKKELSAMEEQFSQLKEKHDEVKSGTENRILKARAKERSKLKVAERQIEELKKIIQGHEKEKSDLKELLKVTEEEKIILERKNVEAEKIKEERDSNFILNDEQLLHLQNNLSEENSKYLILVKEKEDLSLHIKGVEDHNEKLLTKMGELESTLENAFSDLHSLENKKKIILDEKSEIQGSVMLLNEQLKRMQAEAEEHLKVEEELRLSISTLGSDLQEMFRIGGVNNVEGFIVKWTDQQSVLGDLNSRVSQYEEDIKWLSEKELLLKEVVSEKEQLERLVNDLKASSVCSQTKIFDLETALSNSLNDIKVLNQEMLDLVAEKTKLEKKNHVLVDNLESKEQVILSLQEAVDRCKNEIEILDMSKSSTEMHMQEIFAISEVENIENIGIKWKTNKSLLKELVQNHSKYVQSLNESNSVLQCSVLELEESREEFKTKLRKVEHEFQEKCQTLKALEDFNALNSKETKSLEDSYMEKLFSFQEEFRTLQNRFDEKCDQEQKQLKVINNLTLLNETGKNELNSNKEKHEALEKELIIRHSEEKSGLILEKEQLQMNISSLNNQMLELKDKLQLGEKELKMVQESLQTEKSEIIKLNEQIAILRNQQNIVDQQLLVTSDNLDSEKVRGQSLEEEVNGLRNELVSRSAALEIIANDLNSEQAKYVQEKTHSAEILNNFEKISSENTLFSLQITDLQSFKLDLELKVSELENKLEISQGLLNESQNKVKENENKLQLQCDSSTKELAILSVQNDKLQSDLNVLGLNNDSWKEKSSQLSISIDDLEAELGLVKSSLSTVLKEKEHLEEGHLSLSQENKNFRDSLELHQETTNLFFKSLISEVQHLKQLEQQISTSTDLLDSSFIECCEHLKEINSLNEKQSLNIQNIPAVKPLNNELQNNLVNIQHSENLQAGYEAIVTNFKCDLDVLQTFARHMDTFSTSFKSCTSFVGSLKDDLLQSKQQKMEILSELQQTCNHLQEENENLVKANEELQIKLSNLSLEYQEVNSNGLSLQNQLDALNRDLLGSVEKFDSDRAVYSEQVIALELVNSDLLIQIEEYERDFQILRDSNESLKKQETNFVGEYNAVKETVLALEGQLEGREKEVRDQNEIISQLRISEAELQKSLNIISELETKLRNFDLNNKDLNDKVKTLENKCHNLNEVISGLKQNSSEQVSELYSTNMTLQERIDNLEETNSQMNSKITSQEELVISQEKTYENLKLKYEGLEKACSHYEDEMQEMNIYSESLKDKNSDLIEEISNLKSSLENSTTDLQNKVNVLQNQLSALTVSYNELQEVNKTQQSNLQIKLTEMNNYIQNCEEKLTSSTSKCSLLQKQIESDQEVKENLKIQYSDVKKQLDNSIDMTTEKGKSLENVNNSLLRNIEEFTNLQRCYTDLQVSSKEVSENLLLELKQAKEEIAEYERQLKCLRDDCIYWEKEANSAQALLKKDEQDISHLHSQLEHLNKTSAKKESDLQEVHKQSISHYESQLIDLNEQRGHWQEENATVQKLLKGNEEQLAELHEKLEVINRSTFDKDNLITKLNEELNKKSEELNRLTENTHTLHENKEAESNGLKSELQKAQQNMVEYQMQLKEKEQECAFLILNQNELLKLKEELSNQTNRTKEKEVVIDNMRSSMQNQFEELQGLKEKIVSITNFELILLQHLKNKLVTIGQNVTESHDNLLVQFFDRNHNLGIHVAHIHEIANDLDSIFQEKEEMVVEMGKKLERNETFVLTLLSTLSSASLVPDSLLMDGNKLDLLSQINISDICKFIEGNARNSARRDDLAIQLENALQRIETLSLENSELMSKKASLSPSNSADSHVSNLPLREESTLVQSSSSCENGVSEDSKIIQLENAKLKSVIDANKLKMGKMLMKLKQMKEKNDSMAKELEELKHLQEQMKNLVEEKADICKKNDELIGKTNEMESAKVFLEKDISQKQEEISSLKATQTKTSSLLEVANVSLQEQVHACKQGVQERESLQREISSLTSQMKVLKEQCDLITSDNDTFLSLVEDLKCTRKHLESEVVRLRNVLSVEENDKDAILKNSTRQIEEMMLSNSEKDVTILNLNQDVAQERTKLIDLRKRYNEIESEVDSLKRNPVLQISEIPTESACRKEEAIKVRSSPGELGATNQTLELLNAEKESLCSAIQELNYQNSELSARLNEFEQVKLSCKQLEEEKALTEGHVSKLNNMLKELQQDSLSQVATLESELKSVNQAVFVLQSKFETVSSERNLLLKEINEERKQREKVLRGNSELDFSAILAERDQLRVKLQTETTERNALERHHNSLKASLQTLQSELEALLKEREKLQSDLQEEINQRGAMENALEELRIRQQQTELERENLQALVSQLEVRDSQQRLKEDHMNRELQQTMQTIHQQGLRCQELGLQLSQVLEEKQSLKQQLQLQQKLSYDTKASAILQVDLEHSSHPNENYFEAANADLQQRLHAVESELELEKQRRLLLQEEMIHDDSPSALRHDSGQEYKLIIEEEPEYIPERRHLITRNVQTHWSKVHRWLLGRRNYFRNTLKKNHRLEFLFYVYIAFVHIWLMFCIF